MGVKTLFIGDVNRITQRLKNPDGSDIDDETVTFTIRASESFDGLAVSSVGIVMPWDAVKKRYEALWDQDESEDLVKFTGDNYYYLHINTVSHGQRLVKCKALYNGG